MQETSKLVRSREMLREEALIKSNGIQYTKEYVLPICVKRELHHYNDFQIVSAVVALCFAYDSNARRCFIEPHMRTTSRTMACWSPIHQLKTPFVGFATHNTSYELPLTFSHLLAPCPDLAFCAEARNTKMIFVEQFVKGT